MSAPKSLQIGVMLEAVQLSDVIGIDIFGSISKVYMEPIAAFYATEHPDLAALLPQLAPEITLHYIASTLEVSHFTPGIGLGFVPTTTYATCPHDLDILIIGGPLPTHMPADSTKFIKDVAENGKTVVMSVCTGGMWLAKSGVLKGKKATAQRGVLPLLKTVHPEVGRDVVSI
ncbi:hypothetical protein BDN72DRAFT_305378 [Pluteus cervinus]|uniref:Uncharacterized protein n=1 Tax=Pluteus cervinus TaxID=181527 RepID=A0ACD3ADV9_9AGAR|nr:hypothetical protein BDN72DRAFT_305378 [Pluteus cervinus]